MSRESSEYWKHFLSRIDKHLHTDYDSGKPHQTLLNAQHLPEDGDILPDYDKIERPVIEPWTGRDEPSKPSDPYVAPEATQIERPDIPNYAGEQYEKKIDTYRDAYYDPSASLKAKDPNLATRVIKGLEEIDEQHIDKVTAANTWFDRKLREMPHVLHTLTFTCDEHGSTTISTFQGYPGDEVEVTVIPTRSATEKYHFLQWADGVTENPRIFTIGRYDQTFSAITEEDPKYQLDFSGGDHCLCTPFSYVGYEGDAVTVTATVAHNAFHWDQWDDGVSDNPRVFTVGTEPKVYTAQVKAYPCLIFEYDSATSNTISLDYGANMEISTDGNNFTTWDRSATAVTGTSVWIRGKSQSTAVAHFDGNFTKVSGELMSLVDYTDTSITPVDNQFNTGHDGLFGSGSWGVYFATSLRDASGLIGPSVVSKNCLANMFYWNSAIELGPQLPAKNLVERCYQNMFYQASKVKEIHCDAEVYASDATYSWAANTASAGDFYGKSVYPWEDGNSGIPLGWTKHLD